MTGSRWPGRAGERGTVQHATSQQPNYDAIVERGLQRTTASQL